MTFFKKKITTEEMVTGLYHATISDIVKDDMKDSEGNVILNQKEQSLMLVQHLCDLFERYNFKKAKLYLLTTYVVNNHKIETNDDITFEMTISLDIVQKISKFFKEVFPEDQKLFRQKFLFDKDLSLLQKTLVMQWYVACVEVLDAVFEKGLKEFNVVDEK